MRILFTFIALCLWCHAGYSQNYETVKQLQPAIWELLYNSAARIEKIEGKEADKARYRLAIALAKSGDSAAAHVLAIRLSNTDYASSVWATTGQILGAKGFDRAGATECFARAVEAAKQKKAGSFAQRSAYSEIAAAQAGSGDIVGALLLVQGLDSSSKQTSLIRLAQIAARQGIEEPALALLRIAGDETEKSQAQSLRALAVAARNGDIPAARAALSTITVPLHKIAVLLELFDNPSAGRSGDATLLNEALAAVALNKPLSSAFGFEEVQTDAARGAIALRLLQAGTDPKAAIKRAVSTLQDIKTPANAQQYIERFCEKLAPQDFPAALEVAERLEGEQRIGALSAIVRGLGRNRARKNQESNSAFKTQVEELVNRALAAANELNEKDRYWAGIPIARALAQTGEYSAAYQVANTIGSANQRAYAFTGIARAALENHHKEQALDALKQLETAAHTEKTPELTTQIIGQAILSLIEPLLDEEPFDIASSVVGLE